MLDRLTGVAAFVKAADLGSFTAAATALGITSQMVGKHVAAIEARLGAPLLHRSTRRQQLTKLGERYYARCRAVLVEVEAADALGEEAGAWQRGSLRISAPVGFGAAALAPVLAAFSSYQPQLEVELILTDRFVDLVDEGFDAVIPLGPLGDTSLAVHELAIYDQIACASPGYLAEHGVPAIPDDLHGHRCLGFVNASGRLYAERRFGHAGRIQPVSIRASFRINDGRTLVAAAVDGHGIILQPRAVVAGALAAGALAAGALVPILTDYTAPSRPMYLMHSPRQPQPARLTALVECIRETFAVEYGSASEMREQKSALGGQSNHCEWPFVGRTRGLPARDHQNSKAGYGLKPHEAGCHRDNPLHPTPQTPSLSRDYRSCSTRTRKCPKTTARNTYRVGSRAR